MDTFSQTGDEGADFFYQVSKVEGRGLSENFGVGYGREQVGFPGKELVEKFKVSRPPGLQVQALSPQSLQETPYTNYENLKKSSNWILIHSGWYIDFFAILADATMSSLASYFIEWLSETGETH